ncbi:hypothetical protein COB57_03710 [Candidatus Peregrinibacteria bacterium]|nr:MAG: hypothetical protein COB57_03710 [Candidatus Peregrinibacteria bacterium]
MNNKLIKIIDFWNKQVKKPVFFRDIFIKIPKESYEIIDILGVRRSGKSSLFSLFIQEHNIQEGECLSINFEDPFFIENNSPEIIEEIVECFELFFSKKLKYIFFDEIQAIPHWEKAVTKIQSLEKFHIFITGSSSKMLSQELSTVLTGRHQSFLNFPLSFQEFLRFEGVENMSHKALVLNEGVLKKAFLEYLEIGGFPKIVIDKNTELLKNYFYDILHKDIIFRHNIREKEMLEKITLFLLTNSTKIYSLKNIQNTFQISYDLTARYISYLKEAFLFFDLERFSFSLKQRHLAQKKIYAIDTGFCAAVSFRFSEDAGRRLENTVFLYLKQKYTTIFYHKNQHECDFLIQENNEITQAVQVCYDVQDGNKKREIAGILEACAEYGIKEGTIVTLSQEFTETVKGVRISVVPAWKWMLKN